MRPAVAHAGGGVGRGVCRSSGPRRGHRGPRSHRLRSGPGRERDQSADPRNRADGELLLSARDERYTDIELTDRATRTYDRTNDPEVQVDLCRARRMPTRLQPSSTACRMPSPTTSPPRQRRDGGWKHRGIREIRRSNALVQKAVWRPLSSHRPGDSNSSGTSWCARCIGPAGAPMAVY